MAHTPETKTTIDALLKYQYQPDIITLSKAQVQLYDIFETQVGKLDAGGKSFVQALELNNMGSYGARAENGALPFAQPGSWVNTSVSVCSLYFAISVTGQAMAATNSNLYAFAEAWQREIIVKQRSWRQHLNRMLCADGTGILAQADGNVSTYYVTVDNAYGLSGFNNSDVNGARFATPICL
jgi:hypothetical protein